MSIQRQRQNSVNGKVNQLLEAGVSLFVLRWKKRSNFAKTMFGYESAIVKSQTDPNTMATLMKPVYDRGRPIYFQPDEDTGILTAYVPDTRINRKLLAQGLYTSQFVIGGILTPTGSISSEDVAKQLKKLADEMGVVAPARGVGRDVYGNPIMVAPSAAKPATVEAVKKFATAEECKKEAESVIHNKYKPFVVNLKNKHGNNWKKVKDYTDTFGVEVEALYNKILSDSGLVAEKEADTTEDGPVVDPNQASML